MYTGKIMKDLQKKEIEAFHRFKALPYGSRAGSKEDSEYAKAGKNLREAWERGER